MPGYLMHMGAVVQCPHGVPAQIVATQPRVMVTGMAVALMTDQIIATGCPFTVPPGKPQPCALVNGSPAMVIPSPGAGPGLFSSADQIPAGPPIVSSVQPRVIAM